MRRSSRQQYRKLKYFCLFFFICLMWFFWSINIFQKFEKLAYWFIFVCTILSQRVRSRKFTLQASATQRSCICLCTIFSQKYACWYLTLCAKYFTCFFWRQFRAYFKKLRSWVNYSSDVKGADFLRSGSCRSGFFEIWIFDWRLG